MKNEEEFLDKIAKGGKQIRFLIAMVIEAYVNSSTERRRDDD